MEFLETATQGVMLPITLLMGLVGLYWLLVVLGVVGLEILDFDFDTGTDADWEGSAGDASAPSTGFAGTALRFFHVGEVPVMIVLSVFTISWWTLSYVAARFWGDQFTGWSALVWVGPCFLLSLVVAKIMMVPTSRLFRSLDGSIDARVRIVGRTCVVTSSEVTDKFGQAEIKIDGPPIIIDVRSHPGDVFRKGDFATVVSANRVTRTFTIRPLASGKAKQ